MRYLFFIPDMLGWKFYPNYMCRRFCGQYDGVVYACRHCHI